MAHWFHRNPLKATAPVGYDLKAVLTTPEASKICSELRLRRSRLLDLLRDPNNDLAEVEGEFNTYLELYQGFLSSADPQNAGDSKLRPLIKYKWTNSMTGFVPTELSDSWFEVLNLVLNMALWYSKHGAKVAGKDAVSEDEAKTVHKCLRKAAGLFDYVQTERGRLNEQADAGSDLDVSVLTAYICQCTAEAQEVTVARAVELKHSASLVSALSNETGKLFIQADQSLSGLDPLVFDKWRKYLQLKAQLYLAYAYAYFGEGQLAEDKCGLAVRTCREGVACYEKAELLCKEYAKTKGPGVQAKPEKHQFFLRIHPILKRHLEKAERENGFIYHQKVPDELPELETKATYGLVKPEQFQIPQPSALWTPRSYNAFDITKANMPDFSKAKKSDKELPSVKEEPVYQTDKDHGTHSGCVMQ